VIPPEELARLASELPLVVRVVIGLLGGVLLVAGARVYRFALFGSVFALAAIGAALGLAWGGAWVAALARPEVVALGALVAGVAAAGVANLAHRIGLLAVGGVAGLAVGAGVGDLAGGAAATWGPLVGVLAGAAVFPFVFQTLLKVVTPIVGAVAIVFATGHPERLWLLVGLSVLGVLVQVGLFRRKTRPTGE
jgi:hypothetical protein